MLHHYTNQQLRGLVKTGTPKIQKEAAAILEYRLASYNRQSFTKFVEESKDFKLVDYMKKFPQMEEQCELCYAELLKRGYFLKDLDRNMERVS